MYLTSVFAGLASLSGVLAEACNANNCARAVTGTRVGQMPALSSRMADCSSFQKVTVTPAILTVTATATVTVTNGVPGKRDNIGNGRRAVTTIPSGVPAYASPCTSAGAYSSACSCWGIKATTITVPTPVTTVTVTATATVAPTCSAGKTMCSGACVSLLSDPNNCGACGNGCTSGICENGACSSPSCVGQTCDTFSACGPGGSCVCASVADGTGFCADGQTPCSGLSDCATSSDCAKGQVCAVGTCCSRNVCIGADTCNSNTARMIFVREPAADTLGHRGDVK